MRVVAASVLLVCSLLFPLYSADKHGAIHIKVTDSRTGKAVTDGTVILGGTHKDSCGMDERGECFFDSLAPGLHSVIIHAEAYEMFTEPTIDIRTGNNPTFTARLIKRSSVQQLDNMVVVGRATQRRLPSQTNSVSRMSNFELSNVPGTANDINRILSSHPAVVSSIGSDFDNSLFVRGGHSNENVYLIDGIEMENASHFSTVYRSGGAVGFINSMLVRDLDFYIGAFPSALPPRLSSVIDVHIRNGSLQKPQFQADLNMSGLGLTFESPITPKASLLANFRYADLRLLEPFLTTAGIPTYGDGIIKAVIAPDDNNLIRITTVGAVDKYVENFGQKYFDDGSYYEQWIYQGGAIGAWEYNNGTFKNEVSISGALRNLVDGDYLETFRDTLRLDTFTYNLSQYIRSGDIVDTLVLPTDTMSIQANTYVDKTIYKSVENRRHLALRNDLKLFLRESDQLNIGLSAGNYHYSVEREMGRLTTAYGYFRSEDGIQAVDDLTWQNVPFNVDSSLEVRRLSGYAEYVLSQGPLKAVAGVRGDYFTVLTDYGISPRLGVRTDIPRVGAFSLSGGIYYQFPADFSGLIQDIAAADPNKDYANKAPLNRAELQRCWQAAVGFDKEFPGNHLLKIETYYKYYDREYPFVTPDFRRYYKATEDGIVWLLDNPTGKKKSYGVELSFQKNKYDRFYYSFSGSLFDVKNEYADGEWYNDENNVRATVGASLGWNSRHHGISLRAFGSGGRPYTPIQYNRKYDFFEYDSTSTFYSEHLDPIFSMNLRYSFKAYPSWGTITGYIEAWNILNYTPVVERFFDSNRGYRDYTNNGILPVGGITVDF